jgi:hypothetical protein
MTPSGDGGTAETLPLALLTFVVGSLVIAQAWAVVSTRDRAASAARAGARAYVEADAAQADASAHRAVERSLGRAEGFAIKITGRALRCRPVTVEVSATVPLLRLPWIGATGAVRVAAAHAEIVDPYRADLPGTARCDR